MDLFIDKLAQKISSNDAIRVNQAAEAKEIRKLKEKVENYERLLQEMKLVNLKNIESAQKLSDMVDDAYKAVEDRIASEAADKAAKEDENAVSDIEVIKEYFDKQSDTIHKENVKVYRNVQAAMGDSLGEQTKSILEAQSAAAKKSGTGFLKVMSVLIFLAVLADIALKVWPMLGL